MKALLEKISKLKVLIIGDIMLDHYVIGDVFRISPEAPVPVVAVDKDTYSLGAAANVAANVANFGCRTEIVGKIGDDRAGNRVISILREKQIEFSCALKDSNVATITKTRVIARGQQVCRVDRENKKASYEISDEDLLREICDKIKHSDAIILSDYAKGIITGSNIAKFVEVATAAGKFIAVDPKPSNNLKFSGISLMTPNKAEAAQLAGFDFENLDEFPFEIVRDKIYQKFSPKYLVITLGAEGMFVCGNTKESFQIPTYAREVFDVSGAGDTSVACLTLALAAGESLVRAAKFANMAAGIVVSKHGTVAITIEDLLNQNQSCFADF